MSKMFAQAAPHNWKEKM